MLDICVYCVFVITLANVSDFIIQYFTVTSLVRLRLKSLYKPNMSPRLKFVAALPCEILVCNYNFTV